MAKAKLDRLLGAVIAKLPNGGEHWPRNERIAWLQMMALALDVVYGPCSDVRIGHEIDDAVHADPAEVAGEARAPHLSAIDPDEAPFRFYVDHDGFAMGDGRPISMDDLPAGAILWDERTGIECGDASTILWRDTGTTRRSLPLGVTLKPAFDGD